MVCNIHFSFYRVSCAFAARIIVVSWVCAVACFFTPDLHIFLPRAVTSLLHLYIPAIFTHCLVYFLLLLLFDIFC